MKLLPINTVVAIWTAGTPGSMPSERQAHIVQEFLSHVFDRALLRATRDGNASLTRHDVDQVENAYRRFRSILVRLQNCDYPPPMIPITDGVTDWDYWIGSNNLGFKRGRNPKYDWTMIGCLLELYEAITGRRASGADSGGPTMRFLDATMDAFASLVDPELRGKFQSPSSDALQDGLHDLREMWNGQRDRRLAELRDL